MASVSRKVETAASRSQRWLSRKKVASSRDEDVISMKEVIRFSFISVLVVVLFSSIVLIFCLGFLFFFDFLLFRLFFIYIYIFFEIGIYSFLQPSSFLSSLCGRRRYLVLVTISILHGPKALKPIIHCR